MGGVAVPADEVYEDGTPLEKQMVSITNADGTVVEGFAPGYTIDFVVQPPSGDRWLAALLPDGTEFRFMPKFTWNPEGRYVVDQASSYTLSIGPVQDR